MTSTDHWNALLRALWNWNCSERLDAKAQAYADACQYVSNPEERKHLLALSDEHRKGSEMTDYSGTFITEKPQ